jgi:hypothetical protein
LLVCRTESTRPGRVRLQRQESELSNETQSTQAGPPGAAPEAEPYAVGVLTAAARLAVPRDRWAALEARRGRLLGCGQALDAVDLGRQQLPPAFRLEWE